MDRFTKGVTFRLLVVALALALGAAGCADGGGGDAQAVDPAEAEDEDYESPLDQSRRVRAHVEARGAGAAAFEWSGEQVVHITRVGNPDIDTNLLSAGFLEPQIVDSDPKNRFRWAFDLLSGYADEPGTFEIGADPVNQQGLRNMAFLIWMRVVDGSKEAVYEMDEVEFLKEFREVRKPCTLVIGEDVLSGSLDCPELATTDGELASLTVSWRDGVVIEEAPQPDGSDEPGA